jgi:predicted transcriptional regulator
MTTIRLSDDMEQKLEAASTAKHLPKSFFVKEALAQDFTGEEVERNSWDVGVSYFGKRGSGDGNLSTTYKDRLRDKINAKYHTH